MQYKYKVQIYWSEEDHTYIAKVPELDGVITHGKSIVEAARHADEAIKLHLESLFAYNQPIPQPIAEKKLSGQIPLRMGKDRHEAAYIKASKLGISLNEYVSSLIDKDNSNNTDDATYTAEANEVLKQVYNVLKDHTALTASKKNYKKKLKVAN